MADWVSALQAAGRGRHTMNHPYPTPQAATAFASFWAQIPEDWDPEDMWWKALAFLEDLVLTEDARHLVLDCAFNRRQYNELSVHEQQEIAYGVGRVSYNDMINSPHRNDVSNGYPIGQKMYRLISRLKGVFDQRVEPNKPL